MLNDGYAIIPGLEIERAEPGDRSGVESRLADIINEIGKAKPASRAACERFTILGQAVQDLTRKHAGAYAKLQETVTGLDEAIDNPAADIRSLALQRHPLECELSFIQDSLDRARYVLQPAAKEHQLVTALDLLRLEAVETALHASLSHIDTQERLEKAGVFESEQRLLVVGERTENLRAAAREAHRQAQLAEVELNEERARQLARQQQRLATGQVTRAEMFFAIPALQGLQGSALT